MVRIVLDVILAVYLFGWAVCLIVLYRKMTNPEFWEGLNLSTKPVDWPVWIWMICALIWPYVAWKFISLSIRYRIGKAALKIADVTLNSLKKSREKNDKA